MLLIMMIMDICLQKKLWNGPLLLLFKMVNKEQGRESKEIQEIQKIQENRDSRDIQDNGIMDIQTTIDLHKRI